MSVSSFEGSPVPLDLPTKYQKLATEYAKLRAQVSVLKKAVVDEQAKSSELKDGLRVNDQNLRKAEQEQDSLNFRNQQLTKRVAVLQEDYEKLQNSSRKGRTKGQPSNAINPVIEEELHKKISENARLATMLQEEGEKHEQEKFMLIQQNQALEHEMKEYKNALALVEHTKLAKFENENKTLLHVLKTKEEELGKLYKELKQLKQSPKCGGVVSQVKIDQNLLTVIQNLPLCDMIKAFVAFFNYMELRCRSADDDLSPLSDKIRKNQCFLHEFIDGFKSLSHELNINEVIAGIENYVLNLEELCLVQDLRSEDGVSKVFRDLITSWKNHWMQLASAFKICLSLQVTAGDSEEFLNRITGVFRSLRTTCDYFSSALNDRLSSNATYRELESQILIALNRLSVLSGVVYKKLTECGAEVRRAVEVVGTLGKQGNAPERGEEGDQSSEYWRQEYELLKMTHSKKIKDLEEQVSSLSGMGTPQSSGSINMSEALAESTREPLELKNLMGSLSVAGATPPGAEGHDSEIKKYFSVRANALVADRQLAESKVTALQQECCSLQKRLEDSLECIAGLESSVQTSQDTVARLQEELTTTATSYEVQLASMSEHMANMSDRLVLQDEKIDSLTHQLATKDGIKGRGK